MSCHRPPVDGTVKMSECLQRWHVGTVSAEIQTALVAVPNVRGLRPSTRHAATPLQVPEHDSNDTGSVVEHQVSSS